MSEFWFVKGYMQFVYPLLLPVSIFVLMVSVCFIRHSSFLLRFSFFASIFWSTLFQRNSLQLKSRGVFTTLPSQIPAVWIHYQVFTSLLMSDLLSFRRKNSHFKDGDFTVEELCQLSESLLHAFICRSFDWYFMDLAN